MTDSEEEILRELRRARELGKAEGLTLAKVRTLRNIARAKSLGTDYTHLETDLEEYTEEISKLEKSSDYLQELMNLVNAFQIAALMTGFNQVKKLNLRVSRWVTLEKTSPSGKTMFVCTVCGRMSVTPDKSCRTMADPEETWKCSSY